MTTNVLSSSQRDHQRVDAATLTRLSSYLVPLGRLLFAFIFIETVPARFSPQTITNAVNAGMPLASVLVPASGILTLLGGLCVLFGYRARIGALLLVLFLIPATLVMHAFWAVPDPVMARIQTVMFMKNLSMLGAALLIVYFGAGPFSIDARQQRGRALPPLPPR